MYRKRAISKLLLLFFLVGLSQAQTQPDKPGGLIKGKQVKAVGKLIQYGPIASIPNASYLLLKDEQYGLVECRGSSLEVARMSGERQWESMIAMHDGKPVPGFIRVKGDFFRARPTGGIILQPCEFQGFYETAVREPLPVTVDPNNHPPKAIYSIDPDYSDQARRDRLQGIVTLAVTIDVQGLPTDIKVVHSLGEGLDEQAEAALAKWRFEPAMHNGQPVEQQLKINFTFKLL